MKREIPKPDENPLEEKLKIVKDSLNKGNLQLAEEILEQFYSDLSNISEEEKQKYIERI
ncbi:MAG: hypothetical protein NZ866_02695 [Patescibacteria group bacterium]|nr:hypothetical protein [Patescibacteria group bacterium]